MCGIAGIVSRGNITDNHASSVRRMVDCMAHRGPDFQDVRSTTDYSFGHDRLSIVDLVDGNQPMTESLSGNTIVFNGEIYGFKEIKARYSEYNFKTHSDTELILAMYDRHGKGLTNQLPGMFAFALWDEKNKTLFAARDRFGEKPFYYAIGKNGEFIFASELKAILKSGLIEPILDASAAAFYLRRLYVKPTQTIFKNIFTLPPAHTLTYENGTVNVWRYWQAPAENKNISFEDAKVEFTRLLDKAVRNQLVADVPVAAFLSGGLDSSTIVALASKYKPDLTTFSFGFEGDISELKYANQIAAKYHTNHVVLEEKDFDIAELLLKMHDIYDEPFADSSNIPTYLISKLASKHVKVVLTGDGCDELMAGYNFWYRRLYQYNKAKASTGLNVYYFMLMRSLSYRMKKMQEHWHYNYNVEGFNDKKKFGDVAELHNHQKNYFSKTELDGLFKKPVSIADDLISSETLNDILKEELTNYMPGDILVKTDRAAMASSLELRAPFLDKEVAEFCISLPSGFKINDRQEKVLFRAAFGEMWTEDIRKRKKQGFAAPVNDWLKTPSIIALKEKYLKHEGNKIFSILRYPEVMKYYVKDNTTTWALLNLSMWMEKHQFKIEA